MENWNKGLPFQWLGTSTQQGGMEYWNKGLSFSPINKTSANIPPPAVLSVDGVLRTDSYAYDGVLNADAQKVMGVSNV